MSDDKIRAQIKADFCPAVLIHSHGNGQCRLLPGHVDEEHDVTCWTCLENGESAALRWEDPGNGITRWVSGGGTGHLAHG